MMFGQPGQVLYYQPFPQVSLCLIKFPPPTPTDRGKWGGAGMRIAGKRGGGKILYFVKHVDRATGVKKVAPGHEHTTLLRLQSQKSPCRDTKRENIQIPHKAGKIL